jgi:glycosyltransferase involved in cell wall biosynthesis
MNEYADRIYCFTEQWKHTYLSYDSSVSDVRVLGHAVDQSVFSCLPADARLAVRSKLNIPQDGIVFFNANRNSERKRLDLCVMAFANLLSKNPNKPYYLLLATGMKPEAGAYYDLQRIFIEEVNRYNLDVQTTIPKLLLVDTSPPNIMGDDFINQLYNATDIGINTATGEGFGLCQLEHMFTGAPQIVLDVGSYRSYLNERVAEIVPGNERVYFPGSMPLGAYTPNFRVEDITRAMEKTIETLPERRKAVSEHVFASWASVCDSFLEDVLTAAS